MIEACFLDGTDCCGVVFDIVKAFDCLPRDPIFFALAHLGVPTPFLGAWCAYLSGLKRVFRVQGCLGQPLMSTTGMPQGCCLSVVGMVVAGWIYTIMIEQGCAAALPDEEVSTYVFADNLEAQTWSGEAAALVEELTLRFAEVRLYEELGLGP